MAPTIFYSWQSDTPSKTNRRFIKDCLETAASLMVENGQVEEAPRVDQGMQGVYGDEDVFGTILTKIDRCDIFVADVTIVARTATGKQLPNPNVLLELGYASKAAGSKRIIKLMNTAYGDPEDELPFDMAHKRWPYQFSVPEKMEKAERERVGAKVAADLAEILHGILTEVGEKEVALPIFPEAAPAWRSSSFLPDGILGEYAHPALDKPLPIPWENGLQWFLRMIPAKELGEKSFRELFDHLRQTPMRPFGRNTVPSNLVNRWGAVSFDQRPGGKPIRSLSQLFSSGEIWGIERGTEYTEAAKALPFPYLITVFTEGLTDYLHFLREELHVQPPIKFVAGVSGIQGYAIADQRYIDPAGYSPRDEILYETVLDTLDVEVVEVLRPFFQKVWGDFTLPGTWDEARS